MITAYVNELGIVLLFESMADNFSPAQWESLLDDLKSHYIPSFYQHKKRMHVDFGGVVNGAPGKMRVVIYLTPNTVSLDEAIPMLRSRNIEVNDGRVFVRQPERSHERLLPNASRRLSGSAESFRGNGKNSPHPSNPVCGL